MTLYKTVNNNSNIDLVISCDDILVFFFFKDVVVQVTSHSGCLCCLTVKDK